ncbi:MAG: Myo-inositol 2-dehydrogenase [Nitrospirae bacterium]|nr:Myo-inositol 2-dehydrogenase [Nitrospirota bacterium]MEB2338546.1 Gfo/Idh/MocA family oxidoreductase [Nitrospirales bacterium]
MDRDASKPLGVGLIGLGRHGSRYARHLLADLPEARLAAVSRRQADQGVPDAPSVPCHADYHRLINDPRVDVVVAVTPPVLNRDICLAAIQAGKPLLMEKPLAATVDDARAIAAAAGRSEHLLMVAHTLRFDPTVLALRARRPEVGTLCSLSLASRMEPQGHPQQERGFGGRGCLLEIGIHLLDLIRVVTGDEVEQVSCDMDVVPPLSPEQLVLARLTTRRGLRCLVDVSRVSSGRIGRVELVGQEGQLSADWCARRLVQLSAQTGAREWSIQPEPTILSVLRAFCRSVREGVPPPVTVEDGARAVEAAEACYLSARDGGRVVRVEYA